MTIRPAIIKRLFAHSGNQCAFPTCTTPIVESETVLGEICHIAAASAQGPRYNPAQTDEQRNGFDNLILLCPTHHTVIDADLEAYTVNRLKNMKASHEGQSKAVPEAEANGDAILLIEQSVRTENQSGGLAAHTVNASAIYISNGAASGDRTAEAVERLWQIILGLKSAFSDITFVDMILTPEELDSYFDGRKSHPVFETIHAYRSHDLVIHKMNSTKFSEAEKDRPFISPRLWSIYCCIQAIYGRTGMLYSLSFKKRRYENWRKDSGIDQHLRAVLPGNVVDEIKQANSGLLGLLGSMENLFLEVARTRTPK